MNQEMPCKACVNERKEWTGKCAHKEKIVEDAATGGKKGQKRARFDLLPWAFLHEVAEVYGWACESGKYEDRNWEKGYSWGLSIGALFRHTTAWVRGEKYDPESHLSHLAHACFHLATLFTFERDNVGTDDRSNLGRLNTEAAANSGTYKNHALFAFERDCKGHV